MNRIPFDKRIEIINLLVDGNGLRATAQLVDCSVNTVTKLLMDVGAACVEYQNKRLVDLPCRRVQCDEIWSFGSNKKGFASTAGGYGEVWIWTAICADTKLIASWMVGSHDGEAASAFIADLAPRLANRMHLFTDGHKPYLQSVEDGFGTDVDYGVTPAKLHGTPGEREDERRYSVAERTGTTEVGSRPHEGSISFAECQSLTMRMSALRFTLPTNRSSKQIESHALAIALHFMYYNFGRAHGALRVTPAMEIGIADHVWSLEEITALVPEPTAKKRGPYKKHQSKVTH